MAHDDFSNQEMKPSQSELEVPYGLYALPLRTKEMMTSYDSDINPDDGKSELLPSPMITTTPLMVVSTLLPTA